MARDKNPASESDDDNKEAESQGEEAPKKRFGKKFLLIAGSGGLVFVLALGAGLYFLIFSGSHARANVKAPNTVALPLAPPQVAFYDMPDIVVNIQSPDPTPAYLKLSVALELAAPEEKAGIQALMPRIVDEFQSYLRELRIDDLHGSAGVFRVKEELLRRVNVAAAPYPVRDVLLKEMIVQ